jgi:hypothetical protein
MYKMMAFMIHLDRRAARVLFPLIVFIAGVLSFAANASPQDGKGFEKAPPAIIDAITHGRPQDIIVLLDDAVVQKETAVIMEQTGLAQDSPEIIALKARMFGDLKQDVISLLPAEGFNILIDYSHLPMMFIKIKSLYALELLLGQPAVVAVYEDGKYTHFLSESLPLINQPAVAASGKVGTGTAVVVLDTGVDYTRPAFGTCTSPAPGYCSDTSPPAAPPGCKVACVRDFTPTDDGSLDDDGHGTNVSGIVLGVAPDTRIIGLDVFRTDGYAYDSDLINAINWSIANRAIYNIVAINMSLGGGGYTSPCTGALGTPIASARSAGILSAIASGNNGYNNRISYPACLPGAISVGAVYDANVGARYWSVCTDLTTYADLVACFSNSASFLTMLGPGCIITSAGISMCGTSQATPHIAGSIAVLKGTGAFPSDTPDTTVSRMTSTGVLVTDPKNGITKPRIDLLAATGGGGATYSISGTVTSGGGPLAGVTMTLSGAATGTTTTDSNGNYTFSNLANGNYTVTPSMTGYTFSPASRTVTISGANVTGQNFTGTPTGGGTFSISGRVTVAGGSVSLPLSGVTMTLSGAATGTTTTNSNGNYTFSNLANGNYTVTPSMTGYTFSPASRTVTISGANVTGQNFTAGPL